MEKEQLKLHHYFYMTKKNILLLEGGRVWKADILFI